MELWQLLPSKKGKVEPRHRQTSYVVAKRRKREPSQGGLLLLSSIHGSKIADDGTQAANIGESLFLMD